MNPLTYLRWLSLAAVLVIPLVTPYSAAPNAPLDSMLPQRSASPESVLIPLRKLPMEFFKLQPEISSLKVTTITNNPNFHTINSTLSPSLSWNKLSLEVDFPLNLFPVILQIVYLFSVKIRLNPMQWYQWRLYYRVSCTGAKFISQPFIILSVWNHWGFFTCTNVRLIRHWRITCNWRVIALYRVSPRAFVLRVIQITSLHALTEWNMCHICGPRKYLWAYPQLKLAKSCFLFIELAVNKGSNQL